MELLLVRDIFTDVSTEGILTIDGEFECDTLEDRDRKIESSGEKVYGETCIPRGRYKIIYDMSTKYGKLMPHILNVPYFVGIRIHPGNKAEDSEGCILVGKSRARDWINSSVAAFDALLIKMKKAWDSGEEIWITIQ
jgi:hypothetical protein